MNVSLSLRKITDATKVTAGAVAITKEALPGDVCCNPMFSSAR
jgi:hypothetical protein